MNEFLRKFDTIKFVASWSIFRNFLRIFHFFEFKFKFWIWTGLYRIKPEPVRTGLTGNRSNRTGYRRFGEPCLHVAQGRDEAERCWDLAEGRASCHAPCPTAAPERPARHQPARARDAPPRLRRPAVPCLADCQRCAPAQQRWPTAALPCGRDRDEGGRGAERRVSGGFYSKSSIQQPSISRSNGWEK